MHFFSVALPLSCWAVMNTSGMRCENDPRPMLKRSYATLRLGDLELLEKDGKEKPTNRSDIEAFAKSPCFRDRMRVMFRSRSFVRRNNKDLFCQSKWLRANNINLTVCTEYYQEVVANLVHEEMAAITGLCRMNRTEGEYECPKGWEICSGTRKRLCYHQEKWEHCARHHADIMVSFGFLGWALHSFTSGSHALNTAQFVKDFFLDPLNWVPTMLMMIPEFADLGSEGRHKFKYALIKEYLKTKYTFSKRVDFQIGVLFNVNAYGAKTASILSEMVRDDVLEIVVAESMNRKLSEAGKGLAGLAAAFDPFQVLPVAVLLLKKWSMAECKHFPKGRERINLLNSVAEQNDAIRADFEHKTELSPECRAQASDTT